MLLCSQKCTVLMEIKFISWTPNGSIHMYMLVHLFAEFIFVAIGMYMYASKIYEWDCFNLAVVNQLNS